MVSLVIGLAFFTAAASASFSAPGIVTIPQYPAYSVNSLEPGVTPVVLQRVRFPLLGYYLMCDHATGRVYALGDAQQPSGLLPIPFNRANNYAVVFCDSPSAESTTSTAPPTTCPAARTSLSDYPALVAMVVVCGVLVATAVASVIRLFHINKLW